MCHGDGMSVLEKCSDDAEDPRDGRPAAAAGGSRRRRRRRLRRAGIAVLLVFALLGVHSAGTWLFGGAPTVGHFRSAEGRETYRGAYQETAESLPEPA